MKRFTLLFIIILLICNFTACQKSTPAAVVPTQAPGPTLTSRPASPALATPSPVSDLSLPIWVTNPADHVVLRVDPASNAIAASIPVEGSPDTAEAGEGAVWALDRQNNRLFRIDPTKNQVSAVIPLPPGRAEALLVGNGAVWVGMSGYMNLNQQVPNQDEEPVSPGFVLQIDPQSNQSLHQYPVQPVSRLAFNGAALWILSHSVIDTPLQVIDLGSKQGMVVPFQNAPPWLPAEAMAVDANNLWLFSSAYGKIFHASPKGQVSASIDVSQRQPTGYADLLLTSSGLWAATPWGTVLHIDPVTNQVKATIEFNAPLTQLLSGGGAVWVLSQQTGMLYRIDPLAGAVAAQIQTGSPVKPTVIPSPTPRIVVWKPCKDGPTSRLKVGDLAYVTKDPPLPNRVRREPNRQAEILGLINPGGSMEILEGPTCAEGWVWWKVKNADLTGWTPEGDKETYWLIPLFK